MHTYILFICICTYIAIYYILYINAAVFIKAAGRAFHSPNANVPPNCFADHSLHPICALRVRKQAVEISR